MSKKALRELFEWFISIAIAVIAALCIKAYLFDVIQVSGESMVPTLHNNDRLAVEKISLMSHSIKRGQIIIFDSGSAGNGIYIKRVIAIAGDTIEISDGNVYLNDQLLEESYLPNSTYTASGNLTGKIVIPDKSIFVLGDNRSVSEDSRYLGCIPINKIKGHVLCRIYPFTNLHIRN